MDRTSRVRILVLGIVTVAAVIGAFVALGVLIDAALGLPRILSPLQIVSVILTPLGILLEGWGTRTLWVVGGGTPHPRGAPNHLVTSGPYRFSRNPLYLARIMILGGASFLLVSTGTLALTIGLLLAVNFVLLPREERRLRQRFELAYERYCASVPRWIKVRP